MVARRPWEKGCHHQTYPKRLRLETDETKFDEKNYSEGNWEQMPKAERLGLLKMDDAGL